MGPVWDDSVLGHTFTMTSALLVRKTKETFLISTFTTKFTHAFSWVGSRAADGRGRARHGAAPYYTTTTTTTTTTATTTTTTISIIIMFIITSIINSCSIIIICRGPAAVSRQPSLRQPSKRQPSKSFSRSSNIIIIVIIVDVICMYIYIYTHIYIYIHRSPSPFPSPPSTPAGGSSPTSRSQVS